jgi:hypothetical protein
MNLVGKIFVVFIFVMSLVFMSLALMVYSSQKNWRDVVMLTAEQKTPDKEEGLKWQLEKAKAENTTLKNEKDTLTKEYATEKAAQQQQLAKLQTELDIVTKQRKSLEAGRADLEKKERDAVAAMTATQKNITDYSQQLERQRTALLQSQQDRDKHFKEVVRLTDLLNQAVNDKEQLRKRMGDLAKDLAKADEALRWNKIDKNSEYKNANPPKIDGLVTSVLEGGVIEVSLGSDDGLRKGHFLQVYRINGGQSTYVGRAEVMKTDPSKSVCKLDPNIHTSQVMVNDRVASKIE